MRAAPRVIGGGIAPPARWQSLVGLLNAAIPNNFQAQFCGGSLVQNRFVLTAAHCVDQLAGQHAVQILAGTASLASGGTRYNVEKIIIHPKWDPVTFDYDVAVLKLTQNVAGAKLNTLLEKADEGVVTPPKTVSFVAGWGNTVYPGSTYPTALNEVKVKTVRRAACNSLSSYNGEITGRMICAGYKAGGKNAWQGDSDGPLVVKDANGKWRLQIGITSWGVGCALPNFYGVYTRVAVLSAWVLQTIAKN